MAGFLGMLTGAGLQYLGHREQRTRQQKDMFADLIANQVQQTGDASILKDKNAKAAFEYKYGEGSSDAYGQMVEAGTKMNQAAQQWVQSGGGPQGQGGQQPPQDMRSRLQSMMERATQMMNDPNPQHQQIGKNFFNLAKTQLQEMDKQAGKGQETQYQKDSLALREQALQASQMNAQINEQLRAQQIAMTGEIAKMNAVSSAQFRQFSENMAQTKEEDARSNHFQAGLQNLQQRRQDIVKMMSAATPPDPSSMKAVVSGYNANLRQLKSAAKRYGYDDTAIPDPLKVGATPTHGPFGLFGGKTTLEEDTPTAKSEIGSLDDARKALGL